MNQGAPIPRRIVRLTAFSLALVLVAGASIADLAGGRQVNTSVVYGVLLLPLLWTRSRVLLWTVALLALGLTFGVYWIEGTETRGLLHRMFAAGVVIATAAILHSLIVSFNRLEQGRRVLARQNRRLAAVNARLHVRDKIVARQNEELTRQAQELDRRRQEAEESANRKTRFLAAVSHDIRTPANAINLLAELIRSNAADPQTNGELSTMVTDLKNSATTLVNLVTEVLDLARFDIGHIELNETRFDLVEALGKASRQAGVLVGGSAVKVTFDARVRSLPVRTDRIKLDRVVGNLLNNAIKFTKEGSIDIVLCIDDSARPCIQISDTGVGIAEHDLSHVFDEFHQLGNHREDSSHGVGLGLAICQRLVKALGGRLSVTSRLGHGSCFTIELPCRVVESFAQTGTDALPDSEPTASSLEDSSDPSRLAGLRILLIEDDAVTRHAVRRIFQQQGATVVDAPDGLSAIRQLREFDAQVVLLDMNLPDMTGTEVLRQSPPPSARRHVLAITGDSPAEPMDTLRALGVEAVLIKPVDLDQLIRQVSQVIDGTANNAIGKA